MGTPATASREATMDVAEWLRSLGFEEYAPAFHDHGVDMRVLPDLTAEDLKDLGIGMVICSVF
jgi:hypothetical protein